MKTSKMLVLSLMMPSLIYSASPSFSLKKQEGYRLSHSHELNLFMDRSIARKDNVNNPDGELVELDETNLKVVPDLNFAYKKGVSSALIARVLGTLVNHEDQAYLSEFYYRTVFGKTNVLVGKYIQSVETSYFDNPADLLLPNTETEIVQDKINDDFKTGNTMFRVSRRFGDFSVEGVVADYYGETLFEDEFSEQQVVLKFSQNFFEGAADISFLLRGVTDGQNGVGAIFSSEVGGDTIVYFQTSSSINKYRVAPKQTAAARPANPQQPVSERNPIVQPAIYQFQFDPEQIYNSHVFGFQHTGATTWSLISEYFYHGAGFNDDEAEMIRDGLESAHEGKAYQDKRFEGDGGNPYAGFLRRNLTILRIGNYRQNYFKTRFATGQIFKNFELTPVLLYNLDDKSYFSQMNLEFAKEDYTVTLSAQGSVGDDYSENGMSSFQNAYIVKIQFIL